MKSIITLSISFLILACSGNSSSQNQRKIINNERFKLFLENFKEKNLPIELVTKLDNEFNFNREIKFDEVKEFLCLDKSKNCLEQQGGGYFQFYFSNCFNTKGSNFLIVSYYRVSSYDTKYILATFDYTGKIIDNLEVAGQVDNQSQTEARISDKLDISMIEIVLSNKISENEFEAKRFVSNYRIDNEGKFIYIKKTDEGTGKYQYAKEQSYRLVIIN